MPRVGGIVAAIVSVLVLLLVLSAVHLLPQLRNPFAETTTVRSQPVILKSITNLSRYEAASGSFQVVVDLTKRSSIIPSFLEGSETLFIGQGTDIAFVDFATLKNQAITVNKDRTSVTVTLPKPQLEPAVLNVNQSYVYAQQQGLFNRVGNFFSGNPNSQQQVYQIAQQKIGTAARQSPLLADAQKNTEGMLTGMLTSLGFQHVYAQQQGLFNRVGNFFSGNPNSQQQVYQIAQQKIGTAARQSPLLADAQKNTEGMLTGMLTSLGFQHVTVTFGPGLR